MSQVFIVDVDPIQIGIINMLLDQLPLSKGRPEGRNRDRASAALEKVAEGKVQLTSENVETILGIVDKATTGTVRQDGVEVPGALTGGGFRKLHSFVKRLEAAYKGDVSGMDGIEVAALGNGTEKTLSAVPNPE